MAFSDIVNRMDREGFDNSKKVLDAVKEGKWEKIQGMLYDSMDSYGGRARENLSQALLIAAKNNQVAVVESLIQRGALAVFVMDIEPLYMYPVGLCGYTIKGG